MATGPLICSGELQRLRRDLGTCPALLDVRWDLSRGARQDLYVQGHLPGAVFVDLDADLAAPAGPRGRHPLPEPADFQARMRAAGVSDGRAVVVYDSASSMAAARGWWLLRYFGHAAVRVLDGGLSAWTQAGLPLEAGVARAQPGDFTARPGAMAVLDAAGAAALPGRGRLLDARAPKRFRGEVEPIDPVAGHIPGAVNRPTTMNVDSCGRFLAAATLREAFSTLGIGEDTAIGAYCGSGVSAAHQVLALELAGYRGALYPGSWSEWIHDRRRPVATGA